MEKFELIENFQNIPVSYVGVHPIKWKELTGSAPDVGFREILIDNELRLDEETIIRVGYDECEINDGVAPNTVLGSGIINIDQAKTISYVIIHRKEE